MKVIVHKPFKDIHTKKMVKPGETEMTAKRFKEATANLEKFGGGFLSSADAQEEKEG
ncbi:hypothetical protein LJC61_02750 [Ruminococcaceae bacterium OttesenSCG-928-A16]|nr:hypothetical protein [Ruminococcaceae bacterium OttesenSCG-928-A16]